MTKPPQVASEARTVLRLNLLRDHDAECDQLRREVLGLAGAISADPSSSKAAYRERHQEQRLALLKRKSKFLDEFEQQALEQFASGADVDPTRITPEITLVESERDGSLFNYATLLWSVPVTGGYGRRSRFLVRDKQNGKLIGVFALSDPVYNLKARDHDIGWEEKQKKQLLYRVLDASVIGAVLPYSLLLGGKLVALAAISKQALEYIERKYKGRTTKIEKRVINEPRPVLITTTSALGRSSIYNRLRSPERELYLHVGWTQGYGHFELPDLLFHRLVLALRESGDQRATAYRYGQGPSWRMRTVRLGLEYLKVDPDLLLHHGLQREVFAAPTARNWREILRGEQQEVAWFDDDFESLAEFFRARWAVPRAARVPEYTSFNPATIQLREVAYRQLKLAGA